MGKAMVSTTVGVEGLPVRHGEHLVIADTVDDFANAVITLLRDSKKRTSMGHSARDFIRENFSWEKAGRTFSDICWKVANHE